MKPKEHTPWGAAQHVEQLADGIWSVSTAGHGGMKLDDERNRQIPAPFRADGGWYEEDECWAVPGFFFSDAWPEHRRAEVKRVAERTLKNGFPDQWEKHFGVTLDPSESSDKRERLARERNRERMVVYSAIGIDGGLVRCHAKRESTGEKAVYIIPREVYRATRPGEWWHVVDETTYKPEPQA